MLKNYDRIIIKIGYKKKSFVLTDEGLIKNLKCATCNDAGNSQFYSYKDGQIVCPVCGRTVDSSVIIKTPEDIRAEQEETEKRIHEQAIENLQLIDCGMDYSTGIKFYTLSARVEPEAWEMIKSHFSYYNRGWDEDSDVDFLDSTPTGWLTTQPEKVEKILVDSGLIKPENTLEPKMVAIEKEATINKEKNEKANKVKSEIDSFFDDAEKPIIDDYTHHVHEYDEVIKKVIENPYYPWSIYGGGQEWVICRDHIWFLRNNGGDGDNWGLNNVATGGAGAIGVRVPYSKELEDLINEYVNLYYE